MGRCGRRIFLQQPEEGTDQEADLQEPRARVYASELFPTAIRATGYGWTTNLFGRITEVGASFLVAGLINTLGISWSVAVVSLGPIFGALVVLRYAPETKGLTLEEVQRVVGGGMVLADEPASTVITSAPEVG